MIGIIDYGAGNLKSVQKAFEHLGYEAKITNSKREILSASHVVLPGVGAFSEAAQSLFADGLNETIKQVISSGTPFLGICLGLHLLFEGSEESIDCEGLGIFKGRIVRIPKTWGLKIPHMGWNSIDYDRDCPLFSGIGDEPYVYFVHSYYLKTSDRRIVCSSSKYGADLDVGIWRDNVFALQFHPEKSSGAGLHMLKNFARLGKGGKDNAR